MDSIRGKLTRMYIAGLLVMALWVMGTNTVLVNSYSKNSAKTILNEACNTLALTIDNQLSLIEQAVQDIYLLSVGDRPELTEFSDPLVVSEYVDSLCGSAIRIAEQTDCALAIYLRINPDLVNSGSAGFFCVLNSETGRIEEVQATDLSAYDRSDREHVGWYYEPIEAQKPIWMTPYLNQNINMEMISYVMPVYSGSQLLGVLGMDVDFQKILELSSGLDIYPGASAALICMEDRTAYQGEPGIFTEGISEELFRRLSDDHTSEQFTDYKKDNVKYKLSSYTLKNGMELVMYVPKNEIYARRHMVLLHETAIFLLLLLLLITFVMRGTRKIFAPIQKMIDVTREYADGKWESTLEGSSYEELQLLTESINAMADHTRAYLKDINEKAFLDVLTGIRNKNAYAEFVREFDEQQGSEHREYAVVVFDLNELKSINDSQGHEVGDERIRNAAQFICGHFAHSPVFRIGGDEFVAILTGPDYQKAQVLVAEFVERMKELVASGAGEMPILACGIAYFGVDGSAYDEIFRRADARMYKNKVALKRNEKGRNPVQNSA